MAQPPKYFDKRSDFFRNYFENGLAYPDYLASGDAGQQARWREFSSRMQLSESEHRITAGFKRHMNVIVLSGIWCGDCARQGPMLRTIEEAAPVMQFRYIESRANPELQDELRVLGATRVPIVVALSEDFFEVSRFGDRTAFSYRNKAASELGPSCDAGLATHSIQDLQAELSEWVAHFERLQLMLRLAPALRERYKD